MPMTSKEILDRCIELLQSKKAEDVVVLHLNEISDVSDHFLICTGTSDPHVRALSDAVLEGMKAEGHRPWHTEGADTRKWVLFDFVDVVVHIFQPDTRDFYRLERLWGDAPLEEIEDPSAVAAGPH